MTGESHLDSPTGEQWHIRHTLKDRTDGPFWGYIHNDEAAARADLAEMLASPWVDKATLHKRRVTDWEETE